MKNRLIIILLVGWTALGANTRLAVADPSSLGSPIPTVDYDKRFLDPAERCAGSLTPLSLSLPMEQWPDLKRKHARNSDAPRVVDFMDKVRAGTGVDVADMKRRQVDADLLNGALENNYEGANGEFVLLENVSDEVVATAAILSISPGIFEFRKFYVDPALQGRGIGSHLLAACIRAARAKGARKVKLRSNEPFGAAAVLYERHGFKPGPVDPSDGSSIWELDDLTMLPE